jgi:DNA helicase-2/ATP-dependent DNA helicase PcrA
MLYGRTSCNPPSRFIEEIPAELVVEDAPYVPPVYDRKPKTYFHASDTGARPDFSDGGFTLMQKPREASGERPAMLKEGDRVRHLTFGEGEILSAKPMGSDVLYEVVFDRFGTKKLMGNYAKLKKIM